MSSAVLDVAEPADPASAAVAARVDRPRLLAWALAGTTVVLAAGTVLLTVLLVRADAGGPDVVAPARVLIRSGSGVCVLALGALLLAHLPRHPVAWVLCAAGFGEALAAAGLAYASYAHAVDPLPASDWAGWVAEWASAPIIAVPTVALLVFPDGRLPGRRWRPWLWAGVAAPVLVALAGMLGPGEDLPWLGHPFLADATAKSLGEPFQLGWLLMPPAAIAGVVAVVRRRRAATGDARAQLRLLERAALAVTLAFCACALGSVVAPAAFDVGALAAVLSLSVLAGAMAVAILRHRLYRLDVVVDRALVLAGLTVLLGGLYVGAVLLVGRALGQDVPLGVALPATVLVAVAFQPLRDRLQRTVGRLLHGQRDEPYAAISRLGVRLGDAVEPAHVLPVIVDTVRDALRLPYVAIELVGATGPAAAQGTPDAGIALRLPLVHAGEAVGTLVLGARAHGEPLGAADQQLLGDFARRAGAAASAVALSAEVQRSRERLVTAREEERRRLRGDLHDGLGPTLAGAVLTIDAARRVVGSDPETADALLDAAAASVEGTVAEVRRLVYALRPAALDQLGLVGALRQQATTLAAGGAGLRCAVLAPEPFPGLPAAAEVAAFRIAQEALTNVARHAGATTAQVRIEVGDALVLEVTDDGCGIAERPPAGVGLTSMRERATELGGSLSVAARPEGGTRVCVSLPLIAPRGS